MLPAHRRLTRAVEFSATVRQGRRAGRTRVVVHVRPPRVEPAGPQHPHDQRPEPATPAPGAVVRVGSSARVGLVVSKGVGSAVVRNRVARRLRHVAAPLVDRLPPGASVVLRALPAAATATSAELAADVGSALRRLGVLDPPP